VFRKLKAILGIAALLLGTALVFPATADAVPTHPAPATGLLWFNSDLSGDYSGQLSQWKLDGTGAVYGPDTWALDCINGTQACIGYYHRIGVADFDRDGRSDLMTYDSNHDSVVIYGDARSTAGAPQYLDRTCTPAFGCGGQARPVGIRDVNGDGYQDLMWFDADSGAVFTWLLDGAAHVAGVQTVNVPCDRDSGCSFYWKPIAVGDVNDDGHADVLWWDRSSGIVSAWLLDGAGHMITRLDLDWRCEGGTLGTCAGEWRPVGLGDLNGDGHQDLMWYDSRTGEVSTWLLNGYGNVVTKQSLQWGCSYSSTCANHWVIVGIVNPDRRVPDLPPVCRLCRGT
jgi:hypothetical protein